MENRPKYKLIIKCLSYSRLQKCVSNNASNIIGDELLLNFGAKFSGSPSVCFSVKMATKF